MSGNIKKRTSIPTGVAVVQVTDVDVQHYLEGLVNGAAVDFFSGGQNEEWAVPVTWHNPLDTGGTAWMVSTRALRKIDTRSY